MGLNGQKVVLITSGQPSLNPRLVKEADALEEVGYQVTVIYQYRNDWATKLDQKLLAQKKWKTISVGGDPITKKITYLKTRIIFKISQKLVKLLGFKFGLAETAIGRCTPLLIKKAQSINADLYIGHNLAALPAAVLAAKKNHAKCGFDAEDFHRNESSDDKSNPDVLLKTYIEDKYIKQLDYFSTASPLISLAYQEIYPFLDPITLLNVFPTQAINPRKKAREKSLKLFWFSQTIGLKRGLEQVINTMGALKEYSIELHLLGDIDIETQTHFSLITQRYGLKSNMIFYYLPILPDEIFSFASQFDIGLATEISIPKNRDICLTNKIFTYIQSGLAILASTTTAQQMLMSSYPNMGLVYENKHLSNKILEYINSAPLLELHQNNACKYAMKALNWEIEKEKLLSTIKEVIN